MAKSIIGLDGPSDRRSFLKKGIVAGAVGAGIAMLPGASSILAHAKERDRTPLSKGDEALLRFAAAAELLETDFWLQYNELGGIQDREVHGGSGNKQYTAKLVKLDEDFPTYIHDNTDDEISHETFLNAYLDANGGQAVNLDQFRTLHGSKATGASRKLRLTNLTELTLDTSWWTRYRDARHNPDLDPNFQFSQAVKSLSQGKFTAIPRTDDDLQPADHLQAIANTAAFHMATIEQGGNSLYPSMAQRASSVEVLRILISIGPTETMHFQTWSDVCGAAVSDPLAPLTDPTNGLHFPNLDDRDNNRFLPPLIMPEPCPFLSTDLPACSVIRPTATDGVAMGVVNFLTSMGLFAGQSQDFFDFITNLANEADAAEREC